MTMVSTSKLVNRTFPLTSLFSCVVGLFILALFSYGILLFLDSDALPITSVYIQGDLEYVDVADIKSKVEESINSGFLYLNIRQIRRELLLAPWVKEVFIRKLWPPGIEVKIIERIPVARWGEDAILSSDGSVFSPPFLDRFEKMVKLFSPFESPKNVIKEFLAVKKILEACGIFVKSFEMSERREWVLVTADDKKIKFGRGQLQRKLHRFRYAFNNKIKDYWSQITTVDLRYSNGLSVGKFNQKKIKEDWSDG
ncbi:MAG: FtsQ-type POTRA domain-containing protein [Pseudomonadota bacterium]|nr:FtsQ-type POTRA domain-containing protein [Pseudomonadota bacterium]